MVRASVGTPLDVESATANASDASLEAFRLVLSSTERLPQDPFSATLLGPSLSLVYTPSPALALLVSDESLRVYGRCWGYLMSVKGCHSRVLGT
jgi:hypothetical protein